MSEPWIFVEQIAEHFGATRDSIYRWIDAKGLLAHKIGPLWKFKVSEVDHWVHRGEARDDEARKRDGS
ncbi:MAG: helix-turn-helix domain-containing protein [Burkholderiales bacterium]